jgi:hypothetical protein
VTGLPRSLRSVLAPVGRLTPEDWCAGGMKRGLRSAYRSLPRPLRRVSALLLGMGMLVAGLAMLVLPGPGLLVLGLAVAVLALEMELGSGLASPRIAAGRSRSSVAWS